LNQQNGLRAGTYGQRRQKSNEEFARSHRLIVLRAAQTAPFTRSASCLRRQSRWARNPTKQQRRRSHRS
jgi:hypothetical protein